MKPSADHRQVPAERRHVLSRALSQHGRGPAPRAEPAGAQGRDGRGADHRQREADDRRHRREVRRCRRDRRQGLRPDQGARAASARHLHPAHPPEAAARRRRRRDAGQGDGRPRPGARHRSAPARMAGRGGARPPAAARAVPAEGPQGAPRPRPRRHGARRLRVPACQKGDRRCRPRCTGRSRADARPWFAR